MSTIHHGMMTMIDLQERVSREMQFSEDSKRAVDQAIHEVKEATTKLASVMENVFGERQRALSALLGAPSMNSETIEQQGSEPVPLNTRKSIKIAGGKE